MEEKRVVYVGGYPVMVEEGYRGKVIYHTVNNKYFDDLYKAKEYVETLGKPEFITFGEYVELYRNAPGDRLIIKEDSRGRVLTYPTGGAVLLSPRARNDVEKKRYYEMHQPFPGWGLTIGVVQPVHGDYYFRTEKKRVYGILEVSGKAVTYKYLPFREGIAEVSVPWNYTEDVVTPWSIKEVSKRFIKSFRELSFAHWSDIKFAFVDNIVGTIAVYYMGGGKDYSYYLHVFDDGDAYFCYEDRPLNIDEIDEPEKYIGYKKCVKLEKEDFEQFESGDDVIDFWRF